MKFNWLLGFTLTALTVYILIYSQSAKRRFVPVELTGVHHLGESSSIPQFYVDKMSFGSIQRSGSGGGTCCVMLPERWRPGLTVDVRWEVDDWTQEVRSQIDSGNYNSVRFVGLYQSSVPIEKYDRPENLYIHIFPEGKVRVVSTSYYPESYSHPVRGGDPRAIIGAATARTVTELFSEEELYQMRKVRSERQKQYGDWR